MKPKSLIAVALLAACATTTKKPEQKTPPPLTPMVQPVAMTTPPITGAEGTTVLSGGTVMTADGHIYKSGYVVFTDGRITHVGPGAGPKPKGATIIDTKGRFVTPGIIDTHSHMGVYALPNMEAHSDGNEATSPVTAHVSAEHAFWPQDPSLWRANAGGVTTIQVLPGSANLVGGRSFVAKLNPKVSARLMGFPGAKPGLKMACGENPKRVYGNKGGPQTRMGNVAGYRAAFQRALEYGRRWEKYERDLAFWQDNKKKDPPEPPVRDFGLETLSQVLQGKVWVHNHCYRADEMSIMLDLAKEFGFTIRSFHHALEAYKIRDRLAKEGVAVSTWADWWGFKMEAFDGIPQNAAMVADAGVVTIIHSDSNTDVRMLNQEAAKARASGVKVGITLDDNEVLRWLTHNPAWALGVDDQTGTLASGKMADVVVWSAHPFSVYARADLTFVDGHLVYDRAAGKWRESDFETGQFDPHAVSQGGAR